MTPLKLPLQVSCPNCQQGNQPGSPYCSRCGAPLADVAPTGAVEARSGLTSVGEDPIRKFLNEGQDPALVRQTFERAASILTAGESIEYIAIAGRAGLTHAPDCVVATSKRLMLYRKKVLGKYELDDCYWRDVNSASMKDGKNGVTLTVDAIQGWRLVVEALPKAQAWRIDEVALERGERLAGNNVSVQPRPSVTGSLHASAVAAVPVPASPTIDSTGSGRMQPVTGSLDFASSAPRSAEPSPEPEATWEQVITAAANAENAENQGAPTGQAGNPQPTWPALVTNFVPTPESVLQSILQQSQSVGDTGAPTRPIQFAAAAFQAPVVADGQPVTFRNTDTDPYMRPIPPMPTLEQIAVFSGPLAFNHIAPSGNSSPLNRYPLPVTEPLPANEAMKDSSPHQELSAAYGSAAGTNEKTSERSTPAVQGPEIAPHQRIDHANEFVNDHVRNGSRIVDQAAQTDTSPVHVTNTNILDKSSAGKSASPQSTTEDLTDIVNYMAPSTPRLFSGPLPLPGSLTSGPLLPASLSSGELLDDTLGEDTGSLATQRLYLEPSEETDTDRPTDINLGQYNIADSGAGKKVKGGTSTGGKASAGRSPAASGSSRSNQSRAANEDPISKMKQLKMLLDSGFITETDYEAKKADILARFF